MADKDLEEMVNEEENPVEETPNAPENEKSLEDVINNGGTFKLKNGATIYAKNHKKSNPLFYKICQISALIEKAFSLDLKAGTQPEYKSMLLTSRVVEDEPSLNNLDIFSGYNRGSGR